MTDNYLFNLKCPMCRSDKISTDKTPNGYSDCKQCGYHDKTLKFYIVASFCNHRESVNVIRTIRAMVDRGLSDEQFKHHVLSLLHVTKQGCIGQNKDIPIELVKYTLPKEWE